MQEGGYIELDKTGGDDCLTLGGDWTIKHYTRLKAELAELPEVPESAACNVESMGRLDTAGVQLLYRTLGEDKLRELSLPEQQRNLVDTVINACSAQEPATLPKGNGFVEMIERVGVVSAGLYKQQIGLLGFMGAVLQSAAQVALHPSRWRVTAFVAQLEETGLNAVPIVALLSFLVGAVIAFLGATVLSDFGASIYTINLVGFSFLREFAVLLAAIMLAGRTASAFTASLGSMKANEEIDALRAQGLNPLELLVLPRVLAMLVSLPALTLIAMAAGIGGGMVVAALALDISPAMFFYVMERDIEITHFWVGMIKAPVFALLIAIIGCNEGFKVSGSAQSVGEHTTSSVVQSIFMVILFDALFAVFFMEIDW
ncbi:MlaE family lipid ABC transporter permease subunit [Aliidiomarina sp. Khilg15.8]